MTRSFFIPRFRGHWRSVLAVVFGTMSSESFADHRPPVKITMPSDTVVAERGQLYTGVFQVHLGASGLLENVVVEAAGWPLIDVDDSGVGAATAGAVVSIPFQMIPGDPDQLLTLRLTHDGRAVSKSFFVGPAAAARRGRDHAAVQVEPGQPDQPRVTAGDAITLRFTGRLVYDRPVMLDSAGDPIPGAVPVGVDYIWFEIIDEDDLSTETIYSGHTDINGYFDTGPFQWDDCDVVGCDDPDIYLRWECDNFIVQVQDANDILEADWSWSTEDQTLDDFTGSFHDFGTLQPADGGQMPILHIHNSIVRAHRWIEFKSGSGINTDHVDVQWPEDEAGPGAYYSPAFDEIYISPSRQWHEDTHTHEYGHHFLEEYAINDGSDYCNGICDDGDDCGHCVWCQETALDAWNEGWPNWLADAVTRDYPVSYTFSDSSIYTPLKGRSHETAQTCQEDDDFHDPLRTEGFLGALLRDIDDDGQDEQPVNVNSFQVIERRDCLALGTDEIFSLTLGNTPTTPQMFIFSFLATYPDLRPFLYITARHIDTAFVEDFPDDTQPPGVVQSVTSGTHPLGEGGPLPCIELEWVTPPDDVTGADRYSIVWGTSPNGSAPDQTAEIFASCLKLTLGPEELGDHYISIRAQDWDDHWSNDWDVFGPFTVTDCNSNGIVDVCEISCAPGSAYPDLLSCGDMTTFCGNQPDCGDAEDCNDNAIPDDCDIATGASSDCNENDVPDECENISHWDLLTGLWSDPNSWREEVPPPNGYDVCIGVFPDQITSTLDTGAYQIGTLACDENLAISTQTNPGAQLTLANPSRIRGNLTLSNNNSILRVNDRLDVDGRFTWTGSNVVNSAKLTGSGETWAHGGLRIPSGVVHLDTHELNLEGDSVIETGGRIDYVGTSAITIRPGATLDHQSSSDPINAFFGSSFVIQGTFQKSVSTARVGVDAPTQNSGFVHVQAGTLYFARTSDNTGDFLGEPGATLEFAGGGHEFQTNSSIYADNVVFSGGIAGVNNIRGYYNALVSTTGVTQTTFTDQSNVISYGNNLVSQGSLFLNAVLGHSVNFDSVIGGNIAFNGGDPIVVETFTLQGNGSITGPSPITVNGTLSWGAGTSFRGPSVLNVNGQLNVGPGGGQKTLEDRALNIAGTATFNGPLGLSGTATINNLATGIIDVPIDGTVISSEPPTLTNAGLIVKSAGSGSSTISPAATNTGTIESQTGLLQFRRLTQTAGEVFLNGGNVGMTQISSPQPFHLQGGTLRGNGTFIGVVNNTGGLVSPGLSAGGLTVQGTYTQGAGGTLFIEIGGLTPITEFDQLNVTGGATLNGTLDVQFINGFTPVAGDSFTVVAAGSRNGLFDDFTYEGLPSHLLLALNTTVNTIRLDVFERFPPDGDCNFSESINLDDYDVMHACFSGPATSFPAPPIASACRCVDMDLDDDVDLHDAATFQNQF